MEKNYARIGVNTNDDIPLNKELKFPSLIIIIRCIFPDGKKLYPQIYLMNVFMNYKMLEYNRIDILAGTDINKTNKSKECMLCCYRYFLDKNFSYGLYLCDGCYDLMQK